MNRKAAEEMTTVNYVQKETSELKKSFLIKILKVQSLPLPKGLQLKKQGYPTKLAEDTNLGSFVNM